MEGYVVCLKCSDDFLLFSYCDSLEEADNASMQFFGTKVKNHGKVVLVTVFKPFTSLFDGTGD